MADDIYERAWGNYAAMFEFLTGSDFDDERGIIQPYNFATLFSYSASANNYNDFLLLNASNYIAPTTVAAENDAHVDAGTTLEHPRKLADAYQSFLEEFDRRIADALEPSDQDDYRLRERRIAAAQQEMVDYSDYIDEKWANYLDANPDIPADQRLARRIEWERERGYSQNLQRHRDTVRRLNAALNAWIRSRLPKEYTRLIEARTYFDDEKFWVRLPVAASHDDPSRRHLWRPYRMQLPLLDLEEFLANDNVVDREYRTTDDNYKRVETKWKVKARARWGIFSGGGSAQKRKMEELSKKHEFKVKFSFKRFQEVEIFRDRWFQDVLFVTIGKDLDAYWGPGGMMGALPVSLVIARGTRIEVQVDDEYKKELEKFFKAGGSVSFGPFFSAGGDRSKDERYMDHTTTSSGFLLEDADATIRLLGARVKRYNWPGDSTYWDDLDLNAAKELVAQIDALASG